MPAIGSSLGLTLPTVGDTSWGGPLNTILSSLITAVEGTVSSGAVLVNSNFDLSSYSLTSVNRVKFISQSATLSDTQTAYFYGGDLYITNSAGTAVQITSGGSVVAASGNIGDSGGTYGALGIELDWNGTTYDFKDGASSYAPIRVDDVRMVDGSYYAGIEATAGMTASYTLSLPVELPAATRILQVGATGAISASNTVANAATFSSAVTCSSTLSALETSVTKLNYSTSRTFYTSPLDYTRHSSFAQDWTSSTSGGYIISSGAGTTNVVYFLLGNYGGTITDVVFGYLTSSAASGSHSTTATVYGPGTSTTLGTDGPFTNEDDVTEIARSITGLSYAAPVIVKISSVITSGIALQLKSIGVKVKWT